MREAEDNVREFMRLAGQETLDIPTVHHFSAREILEILAAKRRMEDATLQLKDHDNSVGALRARLMLEELAETLKALVIEDMVGIADGLADLCYVAIGTAVAYGIPLSRVWEAVQDANMAKATLIDGKFVMVRDAGGKVIKPEGWTPPDIASILSDAGYSPHVDGVPEEE